MSSAKVIIDFQCKETGQYFPIDSTYVGDQERIDHLVNIGYVEEIVEEQSSTDPQDNERLKPLGKGIYELPNGEKVKGKDKAEEALKALDEATQGAGDNVLT